MTTQFAQTFTIAWITAWNSHDLNAIVTLYAQNLEMHSPVIKHLTDEQSGTLTGLKTIRAYWEKALNLNPDIHFELIQFFTGINSIIIYYKGHRGLSAETFFFNNEGKVISAYAHYQ